MKMPLWIVRRMNNPTYGGIAGGLAGYLLFAETGALLGFIAGIFLLGMVRKIK